ncbi:MAG TPA: glycosyltransferase family 39 protein [Sphingomonadaceae bacterium]|nr:glycosyltransferase family 39 protein [Sphingomonadaceae bacterium]
MTRSVRLALGALLVALLAGAASLWVSGAWRAGLSGADEPAHFLNTLVIARYAADALGSDPMAYATEFYLHYPKISIGHWPPGYYAALAPLFMVLPPTPATAMAVNLVLAALPAVIAGLLAARVLGTRLGLLVAALCALTPVALEGFAFFMLDQPLAAAALAATGLWIAFVGRPRAWVVLLFGLVAAWAVLIKGNGWLLLFVPPIHLALTGRWRVLASPWPWLAALLAALVVGPWYWLTAGIAADGFNYQPGPVYAAQALGYNFGALSDNVTPLGLALAAWGLWRGWQARADGNAWSILSGCAALVLATLLLQSLVPVDLDARYMAPALPPLIVLAVYGARDVMARFGRPNLAVPVALVLAVPGVVHLATREPKVDLRLADVAAQTRAGDAWLIDGTSGAEGALAAEMAIRDREAKSYMIRASSLLARSDFMGSRYALAYTDPAAIRARLRELGVSGIAVVRAQNQPAFPHSALLRRALLEQGWRRTAVLAHGGRAGTTEIFRPAAPVVPDTRAIRALGVPAKAKGLSG